MNEWNQLIGICSIGGFLMLLFQTMAGFAVIFEKKESGKDRYLGVAILYRRKESFLLPIKDAIIKRAETTEFRIVFKKNMVNKNYMEELIVKISNLKIVSRIDYYVDFTIKDRRMKWD